MAMVETMRTKEDVRNHLMQLRSDFGGLRALARHLKISPMYLCDIMKGRRGLGPKVLKSLELKKTVKVFYERA